MAQRGVDQLLSPESNSDWRRGYRRTGFAGRRGAKSTAIDYAPSLGTVPGARFRRSGGLLRWSMASLVVGCAIALYTLLDSWNTFDGLAAKIAQWARPAQVETARNEASQSQSTDAVVASASKTRPSAPPPPPPLTSNDIAEAITGPVSQLVFPEHVKLMMGDNEIVGAVEYGIDPILQAEIQGVLEHYKPDYGAFVALDPSSGQVLAMASFTKVDPSFGNLTLHAGYPAASVFKIVTAAAGLDQGVLTPGTVIPFNGKSTALYKKHVLQHKNTKWTRHPTLVEAFAKSINPVFGRIGVFDIGANSLTSYAESFGFNRQIDTDVRLANSQMSVTQSDEWSVAEAASGYTRRNTISPVHGAMMAASIANDGEMMLPRLVRSIRGDDGKVIYRSDQVAVGHPISSSTALSMRELMQATVKRGSARKSFRNFFKNDYADVEVGGKTGSLTGLDPKGRNDWFVGYGIRGERRIAFAAVCVNVEKWTVKSSYVARKAVEAWFAPDQGESIATSQ